MSPKWLVKWVRQRWKAHESGFNDPALGSVVGSRMIDATKVMLPTISGTFAIAQRPSRMVIPSDASSSRVAGSSAYLISASRLPARARDRSPMASESSLRRLVSIIDAADDVHSWTSRHNSRPRAGKVLTSRNPRLLLLPIEPTEIRATRPLPTGLTQILADLPLRVKPKTTTYGIAARWAVPVVPGGLDHSS